MRDTVMAATFGFGMLLAVGASAVLMRGGANPGESPEAAREQESRAARRESEPPPRVVEDCNRYAASRDNGRVLRDGVIGGVLGAGVGAAAGAVVDRRHSVGRGAGIGALVGAAAGTLYGINEENQKSEQARAAYQACLERNGYE